MKNLTGEGNMRGNKLAETSHAERYISSVAGGAMLGAAIAGVIGALIGGMLGVYIATILSKRER